MPTPLQRQRTCCGCRGLPDKRPGQFKRRDNRAGETHFVPHPQTKGTLRAGFELRDELDTAWERALYVAFLVAEVHPFDDGNGRVARVMVNAELSASAECRIIVPTVFHQDYLDGLRRLSRQHDPSVFIKAMRFAHDFTSSIDFSDDETARRMLTQANAFDEPDSAVRLRVLEQPRPWEDRTEANPEGSRGMHDTHRKSGCWAILDRPHGGVPRHWPS